MSRGSKGSLHDGQLGKTRRSLGLTQHAVSQATGISVNRIVFAETGRCALEPKERAQIMQLFRQRAKKVSAMVA